MFHSVALNHMTSSTTICLCRLLCRRVWSLSPIIGLLEIFSLIHFASTETELPHLRETGQCRFNPMLAPMIHFLISPSVNFVLLCFVECFVSGKPKNPVWNIVFNPQGRYTEADRALGAIFSIFHFWYKTTHSKKWVWCFWHHLIPLLAHDVIGCLENDRDDHKLCSLLFKDQTLDMHKIVKTTRLAGFSGSAFYLQIWLVSQRKHFWPDPLH